MFRPDIQRTPTRTALDMLALIFHAAVRHVRRSHGNAVIGLVLNVAQSVVLVVVFYVMFNFLGLRQTTIRGDYILYIMSGIFLYMVHSKAMSDVVRADGPTSPMMKHSPMNTIVSIASAALGSLYIQILSAAVILFFYHAIFNPITIDQPVGAFMMLLMSWASGVGIGMVFKAAMPWRPELVTLLSTVYARANMIASGKMLVANATPTHILSMFDWNPLFHTIDQSRGFAFLNYNPRYSDLMYPVWVLLVCVVIGLMGEFYTRRHVSVSWQAGK